MSDTRPWTPEDFERKSHEITCESESPTAGERPLFDLIGYAESRQVLVNQLENIDTSAYRILVKFQAAHPELVPCGELTHHGEPIWKVSEVFADGIHFSHNCLDHGYDLYDTESVKVPAAYLQDSEAWGAAHATEVADKKAAADARNATERRAQYEALRTEFESKES